MPRHEEQTPIPTLFVVPPSDIRVGSGLRSGTFDGRGAAVRRPRRLQVAERRRYPRLSVGLPDSWQAQCESLQRYSLADVAGREVGRFAEVSGAGKSGGYDELFR